MIRNRSRMVEWLVFALAFYAVAVAVSPLAHLDPDHFAQIQQAAWKAGHVTLGAYIGYWVDRHLFGRIEDGADGHRIMARAVLVAAAAASLALGL